MTKTEALIHAVESDLANVHRGRMAQRKGEQLLEFRAERAKANPDEKRIAGIRAAMLQTERDKSDMSITEREVLEPLRSRLADEAAADQRSPFQDSVKGGDL